MTDAPDTRLQALAVVSETVGSLLADSGDSELTALMSESLISALFSTAWEHQFDRDRHRFELEARALVSDAIAKAISG